MNVFFLWLGVASLESYLTNIGIKALMPLYINSWKNNPIFYGHYIDYLFVIILGLFFTYVSSNISKTLLAIIRKETI